MNNSLFIAHIWNYSDFIFCYFLHCTEQNTLRKKSNTETYSKFNVQKDLSGKLQSVLYHVLACYFLFNLVRTCLLLSWAWEGNFRTFSLFVIFVTTARGIRNSFRLWKHFFWQRGEFSKKVNKIWRELDQIRASFVTFLKGQNSVVYIF